MKLIRSTPIFIKAILFVGMLSACQDANDTAVTPQAPTSTSDQNARTAAVVGKLIKDGNTDLFYSSQNPDLLWKESYGSAVNYSVFIYNPQLITANGYQNGSLSTVYQFTLDAAGRCVKSVTNKTHIYEYNASGQLAKWYNKDQPNERCEFKYQTDPDGWKKSLSKVEFYDQQGALTKELVFVYGGATPVIPDKSPVNPDVFPAGISRHLPIFGNFNTNLVQNTNEIKYLPNGQKASTTPYLYSYTLDYAGKAKNITIKKVNGTLVSSTDRIYTVPSFKF